MGLPTAAEKSYIYQQIASRVRSLTDHESDWIALLSTVVCELHQSAYWSSWTGFYRRVAASLLKVGPYQGGHGCLSIGFDRGVCGACARLGVAQIIDDVNKIDDHIACDATTQSEIVLPVRNPAGQLIAVLDLDSREIQAFDQIDLAGLEAVLAIIVDRAPVLQW